GQSVGCNTMLYNELVIDKERVLTTTPLSLALAVAVDVQQFNQCQIARSILYCSIIIVGPSEEAKSQVQGSIGVVVLVGVYYNYSE
uniref:Uncharacterized protein n=1 Tax=Aegilops tauschii subsp. strangulata TaxID=200361 RepID=A0A453RLG6_AEGTS